MTYSLNQFLSDLIGFWISLRFSEANFRYTIFLGSKCDEFDSDDPLRRARERKLMERSNFVGDRVSRERKRMERRRQKTYAKRQRALIFAFGGSTLKWFERILRSCVFIATVIPIIAMILMAFKILKNSLAFIWSLHVSLQFCAKCLKAGLNISGLGGLDQGHQD